MDREKQNAYQREWNKKNRDKVNGYFRKWRDANKEKANNYQKEAYYKNTEAKRDRNLKRLFGIGLEEYNDILKKQNNKCKICGSTCTRALSVDHCHTTGRVRGLLCRKCNIAIGLLNDDIKILKQAIKYLNSK